MPCATRSSDFQSQDFRQSGGGECGGPYGPRTLFCRYAWASVFEALKFEAVCPAYAENAAKARKNADFPKSADQRIGSALIRQFFKSRPFSGLLRRLPQTLSKQQILRAPQQSGPRNRGKMASEELRNSGGALRWSGSDAAARPPDNALQRRHGAPRRRAPKTLRRRVPGLDLALTCGSFSAMSLTAARATLQILKI